MKQRMGGWKDPLPERDLALRPVGRGQWGSSVGSGGGRGAGEGSTGDAVYTLPATYLNPSPTLCSSQENTQKT